MIEAKEIKDKLQNYFKDISVTDVVIMQVDKELTTKIKVYLDNGIGAAMELDNKLLNNQLVVDYIAYSLKIVIDKDLNKIESEENKMNVKDVLINKLIEKDAIELRQKLIERLDDELQLIHRVLIGKTSVFCTRFACTEEAQNEFNTLVNLRQIFNVDTVEFLKLDIDDIIKHSSKPISHDIIYELNKIIEHI